MTLFVRHASRIRALAVPTLLLALAGTAHAELFPDNEARKAIIELRERVAANQAASDERLERTERTNLDLAQQLEAARREIATLRGTVEVLQKDLADLQKRQRDVYADIDSRLKKQEPQKVVIEGREELVDVDQTRAYNAAFEQFRASQFAQAANGFSLFLSLYPTSAYAPLAKFWLGSAQFATRDFKTAIATLGAFVKENPDSPRTPDALVTIGNSQLELNDKKSARTTFRKVVDTYPQTQAAQNAKDRLATIK